MLKIALVGRPNVGKSTLFNAILHKNLAIVDPTEGTTCSPIEYQGSFLQQYFTLIDTAGWISPKTPLEKKMFDLSLKKIEGSDLLFFVIDGKSGVQLEDLAIAKELYKMNKPIYLLVNKIDRDEETFYDDHKLGIKPVFYVSGTHKRGLGALFSSIPLSPTSVDRGISLCVLGKPNTGKSTLINTLAGREECLTDAAEGTTRDRHPVTLETPYGHCTLFDTAGIKREAKLSSSIAFKGQFQVKKTLEESDVVLFMLDVTKGCSSQDKKIGQMILTANKPCLILLNKWDLTHELRMEHVLASWKRQVPFIEHCPVLCISAQQRRNVEHIIPYAYQLWEKDHIQISTSKLNQCIGQIIEKKPPPMEKGKRFKIFYLTQTSAHPLTFLCFCNHPHLLPHTYQKYITHQLRDHFQLQGCFFSIQYKPRSSTRPSIHYHKKPMSKALS